MWLDINHTETCLDRMDWEGEIREVKFPSTFVKEMNLSPTHGFRSVREECLPGQHQKIEIDMN